MSDDSGNDESTDSSEESTGEAGEGYKWREDVLEKVMAAHGIEDRDSFLNFAVGFDHDNNQYLKKAELEEAANAWVEEHASEETPAEDSSGDDSDDDDSGDDGSDEDATADESTEEETEEESTDAEVVEDESTEEETEDESADADESDAETKSCPVCQQLNKLDAILCASCGFSFD